jgi:hypothetical protein
MGGQEDLSKRAERVSLHTYRLKEELQMTTEIEINLHV